MAALAARDINTLVLDEPTNHLDLWACDSLEEALRGFPGTVLVVSHDRWFLNRVTDMLIVFNGKGDVEVVHGNWDIYERLVASRVAAAAEKEDRKAAGRPQSSSTAQVGSAPATEAPKRKRKYPFRKVPDIEADIDTFEEQKLDLEAALEDPETYRDGRRALEVQEKLADAQTKLAQLYDHWEEAMELNPKI
jgi:ATP-binding cassette subfamily F protein 3